MNATTFSFVIALVSIANPFVLGQQAAPKVVLANQPESPLEIVSMQPVPPPARASSQVIQRMAFFDAVLKNQSETPVMAYAIRYETQRETGGLPAHTCQASMGFSAPLIKGRAETTIRSNLKAQGGTTTPIMDLVLFEDGTFTGKDTCGYLNEYQKRLEERVETYRTIVQRLDRDGPDKALTWVRQEANRDIGRFQTPKKLSSPQQR